MNEFEYYQKIKNWDFSQIKYTVKNYTNWDMYDELNKHSSTSSKILDLGTGGGERVIKHFPDCSLILATDFSSEMINTAQNNLVKSQRKNITFEIMDNLNMTTPNNYFPSKR